MLLLLCLTLLAGALSAPAPSSCIQACPANYSPVCGSDGHTYSNACALSTASCQRQQSGRSPITQLYSGLCGGGPLLGGPFGGNTLSCDQMCDEQRSPLCASDGKVYENMCRFNLANCNARKNGTHLTVVSYTGTCPTPTQPNCEKYAVNTSDIALEGPFGGDIRTMCPVSHRQICTNMGTYTSECQLCQQIERMIQQLKQYHGVSVPDYKILYEGPCLGPSSPNYPGGGQYYPGGGPFYPGGIPVDPGFPDQILG